MKKVLVLLSSIIILVSTAGVAVADYYSYSDFIDNNYWFGSSTYSYTHTIVEYTIGDTIQNANIALDFSWDFLDSRYFYSWNEDLYYSLDDGDDGSYTYYGEVDNSVYTFVVSTSYLDDGILGVTLKLDNYQGAYLDGSRLFGDAYSDTASTPAPVPEPASMLLLGTGMVGLAGASRKRIFKKS